MASSFGGTIKLQGESEYRKALSQITQNLKEVSSEMKIVSSTYDKNDNSVVAVSAKTNVLTQKLSEQSDKLKVLTNRYNEMNSQYGKNSNAQQQLNEKLEEEKSKLEEIGNTLGKTSKEYQEQLKVVNGLESTQASYNKAVSEAKIEMNKAQAEVNKTSKELKNLSTNTNETEEELKDVKKGFDDAGSGATRFGDLLKANVLGDAIVGGIKALGSAIKSIGSAFVDIGKQALESYADYEQLIGGVETLFKDSAGIVSDYANNAYKTAGLSANEYMSTVTSFSASLLQSLNGDTAKAAGVADMAITDMADNANKMGTSMEMIQSAYQGFAKQNYTMLDNLKLGLTY